MFKFNLFKKNGLIVLLLLAGLMAGCHGGGGDGGSGNLDPINAVSIEVTPPNRSIAMGTLQQFLATGLFLDDSTSDLTSSVIWSSSDETIATVSNEEGSIGEAAGLAVGGPVTITATDRVTGEVGTATLTVTAATLVSIGVTPVTRSIAFGTKQPFKATGTFSDLTTQDLTSLVDWTSSSPGIATISNAAGSRGVATAVNTGGPITITATDRVTGEVGTATLTVTAATLMSIGVTPVAQSIAFGTKQPFKATGTFSDFTTQDMTTFVTWTSSNPTVATISNAAGSNGVATSSAVGGPVTITAADPVTGQAGTATLTVTGATLVSIGVTPVTQSISPGTNQAFIATGTFSDLTTQDLTPFVTWTSSNPAVATISNAAGFNGVATSLAEGDPVTITAADPVTGQVGTATLTVTAATLVSIGVTPVNASIGLGINQQFTATGTYSDFTTRDLTTSVTWITTPLVSPVATIDNAAGFNGLATSLTVGGPIPITATDPATGQTGTTTLTVTAATLVSIGVTPASANVAPGVNQQFRATGTYSDLTTRDLTTSVTWTTTPLVSPVATISNAAGFNGMAFSLAPGGPIPITATDPATGQAGTAALTVTAPTAITLVSIGVTPVNGSIALGINQQFTATGTYSDATTRDLTTSVTWTTTPLVSPVATISNAAGFKGLATSLAPGGPIPITATDPATGAVGTATLTVTAATLSSIAVTPANAGISVGETQQFIAIGTFSDFSTQNLTTFVTWTTTPLASPVASISNAAGSKGLATALTIGGPIPITATDPATLIAGTAALTVTNAPNLGAAAPFGGFGGGAGMTNEGTLTIINGDIGTTAVSTAMTGFHDSVGDVYTETPLNIGAVNGRIFTAPPPPGGAGVGGTAVTQAIATAAASDALTAFNNISPASLPGGIDPGAGQLGGLTLAPDIYLAAGGTFLLTGSDLTLDGQGDPNAVWVFQTAAGLTIGAPGFPRSIILINGAEPRNVFWYVGSAARIEDGCNMVGTIMASAGVTISTSGQLATTTLDGRALGLNASVTVVNTIINVPAP